MTGIGHLRIRSGRHQGGVVALAEGAMVVGSDADCDVVLSDPSVSARHFEVRATPGGAEVTAREGSVRIDEEAEVAVGFRARVAGSAGLVAGAVRLDLVLPAPPLPPRRRRMPGRATAVPILACAALLVGAERVGLAMEDRPVLASATMEAARAVPTAPEAAAPPPSVADEQDMAGPVAARLDQLGLAAVTAVQAGRLVELWGDVAAADKPAWDAFQRWFDARFPNAVLMAEGVSLRADAAPHPPFPRIQSIWRRADDAYVLVDGTRVREGNALPGGWVLDAISDQAVTLRFEGRRFHIDLVAPDAGPDADLDRGAPREG